MEWPKLSKLCLGVIEEGERSGKGGTRCPFLATQSPRLLSLQIFFCFFGGGGASRKE